MISVLLEMRDDDAVGLAATLATLVPAAMDGVVREVVVLDGGMGPAARRIADEAGCLVYPAQQLADVMSQAKGEWLALFETGSQLEHEWADIVSQRINGAGTGDRGLRLRTGRWTLSEILGVSHAQRLAHGVIAPRPMLLNQFRIGMRLGDLAAAIPTRPVNARIRLPQARPMN